MTMASGKFWSGALPANTNQDTGAVAAGKVRTVSVNLVNAGNVLAAVKIYVSTSTSPADGDRIEPDVFIPAGGLYKLTGEIVGSGERVIVNANTATVTARVTGFEEDA